MGRDRGEAQSGGTPPGLVRQFNNGSIFFNEGFIPQITDCPMEEEVDLTTGLILSAVD